MKYCPHCQTAYTDDALRFCLRDGAPLDEAPDADFGLPTTNLDDSETIVSRKPPQQVVPISAPEAEEQNWRQTAAQTQNRQRPEELPKVSAPPAAVKKPNTTLTILATVLGMLAVFGIIGALAWMLLKSRRTEVSAVNVNRTIVNHPANSNTANTQILNANASTPVPTVSPSPAPTATPVARPALEPDEYKAITSDVKDVIDDWKDTSENRDIDANLDEYADTVDYYNGGRTTREKVRADKQRAFGQYDSIDFDISNLKVTPDATGERATAVFDKKWTFEGEHNRSAGKVQQQLTLALIGGRWLITGEKDLKVYYVEK